MQHDVEAPDPAKRRRTITLWAIALAAILQISFLQLNRVSAQAEPTLVVATDQAKAEVVNLDGAVVAGDIYVELVSPDGADRVDFFIDGTRARTENKAPFDLGGGNRNARPVDSSGLGDGSHVITAEVKTGDTIETVSATFEVGNGAAPQPPAPGPAPTTAAPAPTPTTAAPTPTTVAPAPTPTTAAPAPAPAPTTTVKPTPPQPPTDGWPGPSNTGHQTPTSKLKVIKGTYTVSTDGQVVEGLLIKGKLAINADNVTVRNVLVQPTMNYGIDVHDDARGVKIQNVTIDGPDNSICKAGLVGRGWVAVGIDVSGCTDGIKMSTNTVLLNSWCHDLYKVHGVTHSDCVQSTGGSGIWIVGNNLEGPWKGATSAIKIDSDRSNLTDVAIIGNRLSGGSFTLYIGQKDPRPAPKRVTVSDNVWVDGSSINGATRIDGRTQFDEWTTNTDQSGAVVKAR